MRDTKENEEHEKDEELLLFCEGEECEKNKTRLLSFDAKKYELVTADENYDDADDLEDHNVGLPGSFESSPSNTNSPPKSKYIFNIYRFLCSKSN